MKTKVKMSFVLKEYDAIKKVRNVWNRNPVTKVKGSKKKYNRKSWKKEEILGI